MGVRGLNMLQNYLKIAYRNIIKNKVYSFINIAGLAVGMAVAMMIGLWMNDELNTDRHHKNYETLYQVKMKQTFDGRRGPQDALPYPLGEELRTKYADFKAVAMCDWGGDHSLVIGNNKFLKKGHFIGESAVDMFSLEVVKGSKNPLKDPYSIILTEETAGIIFGNADPIGKVVKMDNLTDLKVTAVVKKQPENSTIKFDILMPWMLQERIYPYMKNQVTEWGNNSFQIYAQLRPEADLTKTTAKIKDVVRDKFKNNQLIYKTVKPELLLHPMSKWRLYNDFDDQGQNTGGYIKYVRLFGILGLLVLIIACINFMNLSTARSEKRAKEVGVRKAMGSGRGELISQFLSESMLISILAFVLALGLTELALPAFNQLTEKKIMIDFANPLFWLIMVSFTLITGLLSGSYPAFYLSSFNSIQVLKGKLRVGKNASLPRKILVVVQFSCSIVLMIGTIVIYQQIEYGKNRPIGFDNKGLISVNWSGDLDKNYTSLKNELIASGVMESMCKASSPPSQIYSNNNGWEWKGSKPDDKSAIFSTIATSYDYIKTMGIKLKDGRDFSEDFATDSSGVILNEAAVKRMGLKNPVGEPLKWNNDASLKVIGVIPDLQMESPFEKIKPLTIIFRKDWTNCVCIRMKPSMSASSAIKRMEPIFNKYNPGFPFDYQFADVEYAKKFNYENLISQLALIVSLLAIFISCLGLFGLASFMAEQRTKEIGVRKVLGASVANLWGLLSKDFVTLIVISCVIAMPVGYYLMDAWLADYKNYRVNINLWIFVLVVVISIVITLLTVSYQAIKAAMANPVKSLKTE